MIELLFIIILLAFAYAVLFEYSYINPTTTFLVGFLGATLFSIFYSEEWGMSEFHFNTFAVISSGVIVYTLVCAFVKSRYDLSYIETPPQNPVNFSVSNAFIFAIIVFLLLVCLWEYYAKLSISSGGGIGDAIEEMYEDYHKGDREMEIPMLLRNLILFRSSVSLYFFYVFSKMLALKEYGIKFILVSVVCLIGLTGGFLSGSRGNALSFLVFSFFVWSVFRARYYPESRVLGLKKLAGYLSIVAIVGTVFVKSTEWVGRSLYGFDDASYYLSVYCGAQIRNLDIYINEPQEKNKYIGEYTFSGITPNDELSRERYMDHLQFQENDGNFLGNVYTLFQYYYQDFGYVGIVVLVGLMALIMQLLYVKALSSENLYKKNFDYILFLYAYLSSLVVFSFFAERFYTSIKWYTIKLFVELYIFNFIMNRYVVTGNDFMDFEEETAELTNI